MEHAKLHSRDVIKKIQAAWESNQEKQCYFIQQVIPRGKKETEGEPIH